MFILSKRGYNLIMWVISLSLIMATLAFIRPALKRAVQNKVYAVSDYLLWNKSPQDYQGDTASVAKSVGDSAQRSIQIEVKNASVTSTGYSRSLSSSTDKAGSSGVEEGSQALLKTLDMDALVSGTMTLAAVSETPSGS